MIAGRSTERKTAALRRRLTDPRPVLAAGAHNGIGAKLVQEAGFDAVWASGFEISASHGVPDADILTMAELLAASRIMNTAVSIPIIADCDTGYGNVVNVIRTVQEYEAAGIAAISIEDNVFPKRCSFYEGVKRELAPLEEHAAKIRAAKASQHDPDFLVIARTEALIAGLGMKEALARSHAYADAGADAILIHSKAKTPDEVLEFASHWKRRTPLVAVPTTYKTVPAAVLAEAGFRIVITANHGLRASIRAMRSALGEIRRAGRVDAADGQIVTMDEVYKLVGVQELRETESAFLPKGPETRAVVLAAGYQPHLGKLIEDVPKSLLEIKGRTILDRQVETLNALDVHRITVVRGYRKERMQQPNVKFVDNDRYATTGELQSLDCARGEIEGRTLVLYGDIIFDRGVIQRLLDVEADISIVVDRSWRDEPPGSRTPEAAPDLVVEDSPPPQGRRHLASSEPTLVRKIGPAIPAGEAHSEFIGIVQLSERGAAVVRSLLAEKRGRLAAERASLIDLLQELVDRGHPVKAVEVYKGWMEIDGLDDYQRAWALLR